jgi:predicted DCC family thiol-disulfide oxidoreductase YuxK
LEQAPIWLFDGGCALCSVAVRYALAHEITPSIRFVAIQSQKGREIALAHGVDPDRPQSFLFIENGLALPKSDGVIALSRHLRGAARLIQLGRFLPRVFRDGLYDWVASNRYRMFGRVEACQAATAEIRERFVLPDDG